MRSVLGLIVVSVLAGPALGSVLFSDNFNTDTSANWNVLVSSSDTAATFAYDYSAMGIPAAPNGTGTVGLKMKANMAGTTNDAVTLTPKNQSFSGDYSVAFDMWINYNGPLNGGGSGSTEFFTAGVGHDNTTVNRIGATAAKGAWFAVDGEGGTTYDYRAYKDGTLQYGGSGQYHSGTGSDAMYASNAYYAGFGGVAAPQWQQDNYPTEQTGTTAAGTVGLAWHRVIIDVKGTSVSWSIDGLPIATLTNASALTAGNLSIGYSDMNTGASGNGALSFGLIDNLAVTPEPTSLALLAMGSLALLRRKA